MRRTSVWLNDRPSISATSCPPSIMPVRTYGLAAIAAQVKADHAMLGGVRSDPAGAAPEGGGERQDPEEREEERREEERA